MLVLSRKPDQEVLIGDHIKITVLKTRGNSVRLGIEAPREIKVVRGELSAQPDPDGDQSNDEAEFTIVFGSSESDSDHENTDGPESVRFQECDSKPQGFRFIEHDSNRSSGETVQFEGRLPRVLKHNRLKQIVDRIATEGTPSRIAK